MQDRRILDHQITASSVGMSFSFTHFNARDARLWLKSSSWVSALVDYSPWLQITFAPEIKLITGIATQGSPSNNWFITSYTLKYSMTGKIWKNYEQGGLIKVCNAFITDLVHSLRLPNSSAGLFHPVFCKWKPWERGWSPSKIRTKTDPLLPVKQCKSTPWIIIHRYSFCWTIKYIIVIHNVP